MDDLYIKRVLKGELEAFGYLVRQHQTLAMRTAISLVKNEADAKDIVQNSFIQAYESLHKFRGEAKFPTWLCRIVINKSLRFIKKNKLHNQESSVSISDSPITYNQGILALDKEDLEALLKRGLKLLAPKEALSLQLFYLEEYTLDEIAHITGFKKSNIKVLLHRGRKNLHKHLIKSYEKIK